MSEATTEPERVGPSLEDEVGILQEFLKVADDRARHAKAEAIAARREVDAMREAWLRAVGYHLLHRPDILTALADTTTAMRERLDALDTESAGVRLTTMEAEYGPFIPVLSMEDA